LQTVEVPCTGLSRHSPNQVSTMIILGIILLVVGFLLKIHIIWIIGIVVLVIGLVLLAMGSMGRAVGGRRHYY
jgi:membrane-bound ClpP family serine protease